MGVNCCEWGPFYHPEKGLPRSCTGLPFSHSTANYNTNIRTKNPKRCNNIFISDVTDDVGVRMTHKSPGVAPGKG